MIVEIKLTDPRFCDGKRGLNDCPYLHYHVFGIGTFARCGRCEDFEVYFDKKKEHYIRPKKCVALNGL